MTVAGKVDVAPHASAPEQLRNVVLVGHSGSGKTTLFEHLVAATTPGYRAKPAPGRSVALTVAAVGTAGGYQPAPKPSAFTVPPPRMSAGAYDWCSRPCGGSSSSVASVVGGPT